MTEVKFDERELGELPDHADLEKFIQHLKNDDAFSVIWIDATDTQLRWQSCNPIRPFTANAALDLGIDLAHNVIAAKYKNGYWVFYVISATRKTAKLNANAVVIEYIKKYA
jgi:hypothetical protein